MPNSSHWQASLVEQRTAWIVACCCIITIFIASVWPDLFGFKAALPISESIQTENQASVQPEVRFSTPKKKTSRTIKKQLPDTSKKENAAVVRKIKPAISSKTRQQTPAIQAKKVPASSAGYYVQAGAFKEKILAQKLLDRMKANGWNAIIVPKSGFHAVWVGPESSRSGIEALQKSIDRTLKIKGFIVQKRSS